MTRIREEELLMNTRHCFEGRFPGLSSGLPKENLLKLLDGIGTFVGQMLILAPTKSALPTIDTPHPPDSLHGLNGFVLVFFCYLFLVQYEC